MKLEFSQQIFENTHIKFHENLSSGSQVVPYRWMVRWMGGQKDITRLIVAFCSFVNVPKNLFQSNKILKKKIIVLIILKAAAAAAVVTITSL